jgi:hypothetical protein
MKIMLAAALVLATLGTAATAQTTPHDAMAAHPMGTKDAMMSHDAMMAKIPAADRPKVEKCMAMSHDEMAKNATCMKMKKLYPEPLQSGYSS